MIKLKDILQENSKAGLGDDPNKPKEIDRIEAKARKYISSLSGTYAFSMRMYNSPKYNRLLAQWEKAVEKHKKERGNLIALKKKD